MEAAQNDTWAGHPYERSHENAKSCIPSSSLTLDPICQPSLPVSTTSSPLDIGPSSPTQTALVSGSYNNLTRTDI